MALPKISVEKPYSLVPTVTDADGNTYSTVKIGTQIWIGENLKTTKYNDGTSIPLVTDDIAWTALTTPAYCWYNNDVGNKNTYGALYNWYTVNTNKLCPIGWHVPTDAEWTTITIYLGSLVTGRLKESGTTHWQMPNTDAINDSKFTALPGGIRQFNVTVFQRLGEIGSWWSSDKYNNGNVDLGSSRSICNSLGDIFEVNINIFVEGNQFGSGLSIRCLKD